MDVSEVTVLGCGHAVCGSCLEKWAKDEGGWPTLHAQQRYAHVTIAGVHFGSHQLRECMQSV